MNRTFMTIIGFAIIGTVALGVLNECDGTNARLRGSAPIPSVISSTAP